MPERQPSVVALSGGIGGAKLVLGLYRRLGPWDLGVVMNTGDDLVHMDLHVSPDVDTIMYTLSGENNTELGWGRIGETWSFMEQTRRLGGLGWFNLGDGDLAVHVRRTQLLRDGMGLSDVTAQFYRAYDIDAWAWPMSDDPVRTMIRVGDGRTVPFQNYFVEERCAPEVRAFTYEGAETAQPVPALIDALAAPGLRAVILCPSNPFVSINPILAVPGIREAIGRCSAPVIAVSPLVGGMAVKGPLDKMIGELGDVPGNAAIYRHYADLLDGFVIDSGDAGDSADFACPTLVINTVMRSLEDRTALADAVLGFADELTGSDRSGSVGGGG